MDWVETTTRQDEKHLSLGIWCDLYARFYGTSNFVVNTVHDDGLATAGAKTSQVTVQTKLGCRIFAGLEL